jgi:hypothetical protein
MYIIQTTSVTVQYFSNLVFNITKITVSGFDSTETAILGFLTPLTVNTRYISDCRVEGRPGDDPGRGCPPSRNSFFYTDSSD